MLYGAHVEMEVRSYVRTLPSDEKAYLDVYVSLVLRINSMLSRTLVETRDTRPYVEERQE